MDREITSNINLFGINRLIKAWHVQTTPILVLPWGIVVLTVDQSCHMHSVMDVVARFWLTRLSASLSCGISGRGGWYTIWWYKW
jgi:hypothetical protein